MEQAGRRRKTNTRAVHELEEVHQALVALHDEYTETTAWTALVCDGICGILGEQPTDVDSATHTGMRFAAIWLKQRNQNHARALQAVCNLLHEVRGR